MPGGHPQIPVRPVQRGREESRAVEATSLFQSSCRLAASATAGRRANEVGRGAVSACTVLRPSGADALPFWRRPTPRSEACGKDFGTGNTAPHPLGWRGQGEPGASRGASRLMATLQGPGRTSPLTPQDHPAPRARPDAATRPRSIAPGDRDAQRALCMMLNTNPFLAKLQAPRGAWVSVARITKALKATSVTSPREQSLGTIRPTVERGLP